MKDALRELLEAGKTPESIYEDALNIVKEMNATRAKDKKRAEARTNLIKAIDEWVFMATGEHMGTAGVKEAEDSLIALENLFTDKSKKETKREAADEDKVIKAFLDMIM